MWPHKPQSSIATFQHPKQCTAVYWSLHFAYFQILQLCCENSHFVGTFEFIAAAPFWLPEGLLLSSSLSPGSFAFHKVIYSRLQPFTASPLVEMTLWNGNDFMESDGFHRQQCHGPSIKSADKLMMSSLLIAFQHQSQRPKITQNIKSYELGKNGPKFEIVVNWANMAQNAK